MSFIGLLDAAARDFRYAARTILKTPAFTITAVLTLAVAIGGNTAMFTVIRSVLLKPLAYGDPDRLVDLSGGATPIRFEEMRSFASSFSAIGAFTNEEDLTLTGRAEPEVLSTARVSANFLEILRIRPILGRSFLPAEDAPGGRIVAMISDELWQRLFARDHAVIGKTMALGTVAYSIVGILPRGFQFPVRNIDVWTTRPSEWSLMPLKSRAMSPFLTVFGRLKPGVSLPDASSEMRLIHHRYALAHPAMLDAKAKTPVEVALMKDELVSQVRLMLWMLFGAVCFVLLIACANVASLLLTRASAREREFAVRAALGASRGRLVRQLLAESFILSAAGGVPGLLLAALFVAAIPRITSFDLPRAGEIHFDWGVMAFAAALSVGTGLLLGLAPSLAASKTDLVSALRARGVTAGNGFSDRILKWFNLRNLLAAAQVALSVVLLTGSSLMLKSIVQLRGVNVGFNPANLLTLRVSLPLARYDTDQKRSEFFNAFVARVQALPGVSNASAAWFLPMTGFAGSPVQDAGRAPLRLNERPIAKILIVAPNYFRTLQVPIRAGRDFSQLDRDGAPRVAIIDETFARRFWPAYPSGLNPVGQRLLIGGVNANPVEIIGIAANLHQELESTAWPESVYVSLAQNAQPSAMLAVRTRSEPSQFVNAIRQQARAIDPEQPLSAVRSMEDIVDDQIGQRRLITTLLTAFAAFALMLAVIGVYGVIAYSVAQRTNEIGIRQALGAQQGDVLQMIVRQGAALAVAGVVMGLAGAFWLTRIMTHLLFQVSATDPGTFASVGFLFMIVALAASYIPARQAARIDPMAALKME